MRAFPTAAMTALGKEAVRRYYLWQMESPSDLYATCAFVDGRMAGFCFAGHFRGYLIGYLRKNRAFLILNTLRKPWLLANPIFVDRARTAVRHMRRKRGQPIPQKVPGERRRFGILSIATDPAVQGKGVGQALMLDAEQEARRLGVPRIGLTVNLDNEQATRFYEKRGYERELDENGRWIGHMEKELL